MQYPPYFRDGKMGRLHGFGRELNLYGSKGKHQTVLSVNHNTSFPFLSFFVCITYVFKYDYKFVLFE